MICVSEEVRDHIASLGAPPEKLRVIPNGVDTEAFAPPLVERAWEPPFRLLVVGRLIANKGPQLALDAAAALGAQGCDVRVRFVGGGPMEDDLRRCA